MNNCCFLRHLPLLFFLNSCACVRTGGTGCKCAQCMTMHANKRTIKTFFISSCVVVAVVVTVCTVVSVNVVALHMLQVQTLCGYKYDDDVDNDVTAGLSLQDLVRLCFESQ